MIARRYPTLKRSLELISENTEEIAGGTAAEPLLSVCVFTYNHASYIEQALRSVFEQQVDFSWEVIIGDDCSSDGTGEVVRRSQQRHSSLVRLLLARRNLGCYTGNGRLNMVRCLRACRGKYIAILDGDDYWTDPSKLQKQVDFLESHPQCSGCFHESRVLDQRTGEMSDFWRGAFPAMLSPWELMGAGYPPLHTSSFVFSREVVSNGLFELLRESFCGDRLLFALASTRGLVGYVPGVMSIYRKHAGGITSVSAEFGEWARLCRHLSLWRAFRKGYGVEAAAASRKAEREVWAKLAGHVGKVKGLRRRLGMVVDLCRRKGAVRWYQWVLHVSALFGLCVLPRVAWRVERSGMRRAER